MVPILRQDQGALRKQGIEYEERDVTHDEDLALEMIRTTGQRGVPQIFIDGAAIGGCDELLALDRSGRLDTMLAA